MPTINDADAILGRYHQAMIDKSADDLADLYAEEAVHELPFAAGRANGGLHGREAIRARYRSSWTSAPIRVNAITNVIVHHTTDPAVTIAEQDIDATNTMTGADVRASFVLVMRVEDGLIAHMRDYTDSLNIALALGRVTMRG
jgi:ketosteroid isomerase-like protein